MSELTEYPKDFVERTKQIIESHFEFFKKKDKEFTFLLNCLLGLIVTVSENQNDRNTKFKGKIDADFLEFVPDKVVFVKLENISVDINTRETIEIEIKNKNDLLNQDKLWFLTKIRNGIAHQHIADIEECGIWTGIKIWNEKSKNKDFEIIFTVTELKEFAQKIASIYLKDE